MLHLIFSLLFAAPEDNPCAAANRTTASQHSRAATAAFAAGNPARAAEQWILASRLNPGCAQTYRRRLDQVRRALNALAKLSATGAATCDDPTLRSARLIRTTQAELRDLPDTTPGIREARDDFWKRFSALPVPAQSAATLLDAENTPVSALEHYTRATPSFGRCPELRVALARDTLASLTKPSLPACDPDSNAVRKQLRDAMSAMETAEPDTAKATAEYASLQQRLIELDGEGDALADIRTRAGAATDPDAAATAWATLARGLPACSVHLKAKHDAAIAAVDAWHKPGPHRAPPAERFSLARTLLEDMLAELTTKYGEQSSQLSEYTSLIRKRDTLLTPEGPKPSTKPVDKADKPELPKERWIHRHRPERNLLELGLYGGLSLLPSQTHQLVATDHEWRPYRKVNAAFGARLAWYPLSFLGLEVEGGVTPTRTLVNELPDAPATVFAVRGHLVGQLPFWRITPFALIGSGLLGTTGALGKDIDVALNVGGGLKFYVSRHILLRLDVREIRTNRHGSTAGGTNAAEVLLGLSVPLNRRKVPSSTTATKNH